MIIRDVMEFESESECC